MQQIYRTLGRSAAPPSRWRASTRRRRPRSRASATARGAAASCSPATSTRASRPTAVATEVTVPSVREILSEVRLMAGSGPTEAEVEAARDYIAGVFPLRVETSGQVAGRVAELLVYDLPADYHAGYRDRIRSVTLE